jgi:hypothetical protein
MTESLPTRDGQIPAIPPFSEPTRVEPMRSDGPAGRMGGLAGALPQRFPKATLIPADLQEPTLVFQEKSHGSPAF